MEMGQVNLEIVVIRLFAIHRARPVAVILLPGILLVRLEVAVLFYMLAGLLPEIVVVDLVGVPVEPDALL